MPMNQYNVLGLTYHKVLKSENTITGKQAPLKAQ